MRSLRGFARSTSLVVVSTALAVLTFSSARAGFPGIDLDKLKKAGEKGKKAIDAVRPMSAKEERTLGETVGRRLKSNYGVVEDESIQRYVTLVGMTVARNVPAREGITYRFIVLDTDMVNAFSVPGGDIYVTRGLLKAASTEAQLAGVLGHELHHSAARHPAKAVEKSQRWGAIGEAGLEGKPELLKQATDAATEIVLTGYGRTEESGSDAKGIGAAVGSGYDPKGLVEFLAILDDKTKGEDPRKRNNGLLGSHPEIPTRIERLEKQIEKEGFAGGARLADRYAGSVPFAEPDRMLARLRAPDGGGEDVGGSAGQEGRGGAGKEEGSAGGKKGLSLSDLPGLGGRASTTSAAASDDRSATGGVRGVDQETIKGDGTRTWKDPNVRVTKAELAAFIEEGRLK